MRFVTRHIWTYTNTYRSSFDKCENDIKYCFVAAYSFALLSLYSVCVRCSVYCYKTASVTTNVCVCFWEVLSVHFHCVQGNSLSTIDRISLLLMFPFSDEHLSFQEIRHTDFAYLPPFKRFMNDIRDMDREAKKWNSTFYLFLFIN